MSNKVNRKKKKRKLALSVDVFINFSTLNKLHQLMQAASGKGTTAFGKLWKLTELMEGLPGYYQNPINGSKIWGVDKDRPDIVDGVEVGYQRLLEEDGKSIMRGCTWRIPKYLIALIWTEVLEPILKSPNERAFTTDTAIREVCEAFADYGLMDLWNSSVHVLSDMVGDNEEGMGADEIFELSHAELMALCDQHEVPRAGTESEERLITLILMHENGYSMTEEEAQAVINDQNKEEDEEEEEAEEDKPAPSITGKDQTPPPEIKPNPIKEAVETAKG